MCLNNLSVYTGDKDMFLDKSLYPFHCEQAPKLISFTFEHPVYVIPEVICHLNSIRESKLSCKTL